LIRLNSNCSECRGKSQRLFKSAEHLIRKCTGCGKETTYKTIKSYNQAEKQNRLCISCSPRPEFSEQRKKKIGIANLGIKNGMYGKKLSKEQRENISKRGLGHPSYVTEAGISKMSLSLRKRNSEKFLQLGFNSPRTNTKACHFMDDYGKQHGFNFKHALNGGEVYFKEVGAWVDGYDPVSNTVFEYDESHHFNMDGSLKKKDVIRMTHIKSLLNCRFIRYNETLKEVLEY